MQIIMWHFCHNHTHSCDQLVYHWSAVAGAALLLPRAWSAYIQMENKLFEELYVQYGVACDWLVNLAHIPSVPLYNLTAYNTERTYCPVCSMKNNFAHSNAQINCESFSHTTNWSRPLAWLCVKLGYSQGLDAHKMCTKGDTTPQLTIQNKCINLQVLSYFQNISTGVISIHSRWYSLLDYRTMHDMETKPLDQLQTYFILHNGQDVAQNLPTSVADIVNSIPEYTKSLSSEEIRTLTHLTFRYSSCYYSVYFQLYLLLFVQKWGDLWWEIITKCNFEIIHNFPCGWKNEVVVQL